MPLRLWFSPRVVAFVWALYTGATAFSYYGVKVTALTPIEAALPAGSPALAWGTTTLLLVAGAFAPPRGKAATIGRVCRIAGATLTAALLTAWSASYVWTVSEMGRGCG